MSQSTLAPSRVSRRSAQLLALGLFLTAILFSAGCNVASSGMNAEGTRYFQQGQHQAGIQRFYQAMQTDPRNADSYYNLGAAYHQLAKSGGNDAYYSQAENYYNQCLDYDPNHIECYRGLAVLLVDQDRSDAALRLLDGWVQRNPLSADAKVELARLHHEFGDGVSEERHLLAALAGNPSHARARAALGRKRELDGDIAQALANYQVSLSQNRMQPHVAARVAALQPTIAPATMVGPAPIVAPAPFVTSPGTRIVTGPTSSLRY